MPDFLQLGVAGGTLAVLVILGRLFFRQVNELQRHQERQQNQILAFFGNHMTKNVEIQAQLVTAVEGLTNEVRAMRYELRSAGHVDSRVDTE